MKKLTTAGLALAMLIVCPAKAAVDCVVNFGQARLASGINAAATSITLTTGGAAVFSPCAGQQFNVTVWNSTDYADPARDPNVEIVRVTGISGDVLTVTRAQESTSAVTHNTAGKTYRLAQLITKKMITDLAAGGTILSVFGRTGAIAAQSGDYSAFYALISHTHVESDVTNLVSDLAGKQATGNYITALTGDVSASGPGSAASTLATVNTNTGAWGSSTSIPTFSVNGKGLITAASANAVVFPANTTATGSNFFTAYNSTTGAFTKAQPAFSDISGSVTSAQAGHALLSAYHTDTLTASVVLGDIIFGNATPAWARLAGNTTSTNKFLVQTGTGSVSAAPSWATIAVGDVPNLAASKITSGQLAVAQGGTGLDGSATGGSNQVVKQNSAGSAFTVGTLASTNLSDTASIAMLAGGQTFSGIKRQTAGSGTGTYVSPGVIFMGTTTGTCGTSSLGNAADTSEDTLCTYTLPASILANDGDALRYTLWFTTANNADTKNLKAYFGATSVSINNTTGAPQNVTLVSTLTLVRTGATTQFFAKTFAATGGNVMQTIVSASPSETLSGTVTIKVTGQDATAATANSVVLTFMMVEYLPRP